MANPKLHQVLAVENTLKKIVEEDFKDLKKILAKPSLFQGNSRKLEMISDDQSFANTVEVSELNATVPEVLKMASEPLIKYWDAIYQKDYTNQNSVADIIVDGEVLATNVPGVHLLSLETRLAELKRVYSLIPTLKEGYDWKIDPDKGNYVYSCNLNDVMKTENIVDFKVVVEPTEFQKAEVRELSKNVVVGKYLSKDWSGMITKASKYKLLKRIDSLIIAVKEARQKANDVDLVKDKIASNLVNYLLDPIVEL